MLATPATPVPVLKGAAAVASPVVYESERTVIVDTAVVAAPEVTVTV